MLPAAGFSKSANRHLIPRLALPCLLASLLAQPPKPLFEEIPAADSGIRWVHDAGLSTEHYLPESLGPGVAFTDFDNDGWVDVFLVNSGPADFYKPPRPRSHALYRNTGKGTFVDITAKSGIVPAKSFGMGVAVADYDNDGAADIFITAYGAPTLYRNNGNGAFSDVTVKAGIAPTSWTTSAVWFDYNGDGLLDLFVCSFVQYTRDSQKLCIAERGGKPGYCIPRMFRPTPSLLYKNNGDGTFRDVSKETNIAQRLGKGLGVVATDVNNDAYMDLFVGNDTVENFLFLNRGGKTFEDTGFAAMVGLGPDGSARSGMGVDSADINNDGRQDLFVSNLDKEMFSLYRNTGFGMFDDLSFASELGRATYYLSGWGAKFLDIDNDGAVDLLMANGHPDDMVSQRNPRVRFRQPMLLFRLSEKQVLNLSAQAGPVFQQDFAARGLAVGDFNNDGLPDALIGINNSAPVLLRNTSPARNHWIGVQLRGVKSNRDGIGARITWSAGGVKRSRLKTSGGSYLSAHDSREILGLANSTKLDWIEVRWPRPSSRVERFTPLRIDQYIVLQEGEGRAN
ncbi:MAG: CRTAC1 family protein [Acidobacteria bacterium]|nr:CRTAC1 family protein [Acidobacteriota bacterium]